MSKKIIIPLFLLAIILFAQCKQKSTAVLNESNLASSFYTITVGRDTVLHTEKGAILRIPKDAFVTGNAATVKLEIKEAYTLSDMVLAGLTTKTGEKLLSSGGMIDVRPADGQNVTMAKGILISIPTDNYNAKMQLYKGRQKDDGSIDWTDPQPLIAKDSGKSLRSGKDLYLADCASCHSALKDATGDALALLDKRRDKQWLRDFIHNSSKLIASGDRLANCVYERYNKTQMTLFPTLSDDDIQAIFDYVDDQCKNVDPATIPDFKKSLDSCITYNRMMEIKDSLLYKREDLVKDNGTSTKRESVAPVTMNETGPGEKPALVVPPKPQNAEYYQFTIRTFGWHNVDYLMVDVPGFENSQLSVTMTGNDGINVNLYFLLPSSKLILNGGKLDGDGNAYGFYTPDGVIPLPQNAKAYIVATSENNGKLYFGIIEFATSLKQSLTVSIKETTKEEMNAAIKKLDIPDFELIATDSKNAKSIGAIDSVMARIELMKPKDCDCDCGSELDTTSVENYDYLQKE